jgi:hypothetical protein
MSQQENFHPFLDKSQALIDNNNHMTSGVDVLPDTWRSSSHYLENGESPLKE